MVYRKKTTGKSYAKKTPIFRKMNTSGMIQKKKRNNLIKVIKDVQIAESEMKFKSASNNIALPLHNNIYQIHCWGPSGTINDVMPAQGVNDGTRIGDRIFMKGIKLRCCFQTGGDRRKRKRAGEWGPQKSEE